MEFINWVDIILLSVLLLFAIFGFLSGFTEKFFSIVSWTGAAIATTHVYPWLKPWTQQHITNEILASIVTFSAIFLVLLISFRLGTSFISKTVKDSPLGALDRSLGVVLGVITGLFLLTLLCFVDRTYLHVLNKNSAVRDSRVWSFTILNSIYLEKLFPDSFSSGHLEKKNDNTDAIVHQLSIPPETKKRTKGYKVAERTKMASMSQKYE
jgi:membrane protein required for colicin V production